MLSFSLLTSLFFSQVGHLHVGGIDVTLYDDDTGEVICRSEAIYGNGTEAGNGKSPPPCCRSRF